MQSHTKEQKFDPQKLSARIPERGEGKLVFLTMRQKRQLRSLPKEGDATLLVLSRNSCVVVALYVRPWSNVAHRYVVEPAFHDYDFHKPLTADGIIDRMVRLIVAGGVKPDSIVFESAWSGMQATEYRMLHLVQHAARTFGDFFGADAREIEPDDQSDRRVLSLVSLAKVEAETFIHRAIRDAEDIAIDHDVEAELQYRILRDDPVAWEIHERHQRSRRTS